MAATDSVHLTASANTDALALDGNNLTNERKIEHIRAFAHDKDIDRNGNAFADIKLIHRALPNIDLNSIDTSCEFLGKKLSFPLLISSMTGGNHEVVNTINKNLALAAEHCKVAMGVGSQRVMFVDEHAQESFDLRQYAPTTVLLANIGAVQFNYGFDVKQCQQAVDILGADGLYLHLNPLQEAVQPEGDVNFAHLGQKITKVVNELSVPVLLKEVGSGLSVADIKDGLDMGIKHFDIAGGGGTSWSRIEYHRRIVETDTLGLVFQDWATPTPEALIAANNYLHAQNSHDKNEHIQLIASGGLRDGIDMVKSVVLGAHLCGIAAPLLPAAMRSVEDTIACIEQLKKEFVTAMFLMGVATFDELHNNPDLLRKPVSLP